MAQATTPLHSAISSTLCAPCGRRDHGRGTLTGQTAQRPMKQVSLGEKEPPSRPCSIPVASITENLLEKLASVHVKHPRTFFNHLWFYIHVYALAGYGCLLASLPRPNPLCQYFEFGFWLGTGLDQQEWGGA